MVTCQAINEVIDPNFLLRAAGNLLGNMGLGVSDVHLWSTILVTTFTLFAGWLIYVLLTRIVRPMISRIVRFTRHTWDDILLSPKILKVISELLVTIYLQITLPRALMLYPAWSDGVKVVCQLLTVAAAVHLFNRAIIAAYTLLERQRGPRVTSLKGIRQMLQVISVFIGLIIVISILAHRDPLIIISGLGAAATVLMLVFKDPIMGVVAGVQLTLNDMLRPGDWITVPSRNINGVVKEVGLATVKVQNFDMTIVTVPPYTLLSESFQNWRGMTDCGGRRMERALNIDLNSIRFLTDDELAAIKSEPWASALPDGKVVNITAFRHYLFDKISKTASVIPEMTMMIRELDPTPQGLPVEIYLFTTNTKWEKYEEFQASLLDSVIATVNAFGLRIYQAPSGLDLLSLRANG
ncbi:MAG: mechanosensitive ion channel family protein [Lachnoclostridium sp.]|nr:mechanosensitive ion channel family protein [Lachnoclostridium sp.]